jgi:serine/threonine protein kinase
MKEESIIYFSKYKPTKKIGEGSFGKIYSAININNNEKFALKMENREGGQNLLESEAYVMCYLKGKGIPFVKSYGFSGEFNILVMELLDKSLEDYLQECGGKFSLKTVCMIADQMVSY